MKFQEFSEFISGYSFLKSGSTDISTHVRAFENCLHSCIAVRAQTLSIVNFPFLPDVATVCHVALPMSVYLVINWRKMKIKQKYITVQCTCLYKYNANVKFSVGY